VKGLQNLRQKNGIFVFRRKVPVGLQQLIKRRELIRSLGRCPTSSLIEAISPAVSATLLFLIAEASADSAEMAKKVPITSNDPVEAGLLISIGNLATGRLNNIVSAPVPLVDTSTLEEPGLVATRALYSMILTGVSSLAQEMLGNVADETTPTAFEIFRRVVALSFEPLEGLFEPDS
jgi:hypothetical protein